MRKSILAISVILAVILFVDGVAAISYMMERSREKIEDRYNNNLQIKQEDGESVTREPGIVNALVIGYDDEGVRSDVILLFNFSPSKGKLNILSIARDTRVYAGGKPEKINALTAIGGEEMLIRQVENMTGLPVHYYLTLNFKGFRDVIDALGGVEFNVPFDMDYDDPLQNLHVHLKKGFQVLNGKKAEQFVRYRKGNKYGEGYTDGDIGRIQAQQEFIKALINQKMKMKYINKIPEVFLILKKNMKTNIEIGDVNYYLKYIRNIGYGDIETYTIPGDSVYMEGLWYFIYDKKETKRLISEKFFM